jgi:hypothetical protein
MTSHIPLKQSALAIALCLSFTGAYAADSAPRLNTEKIEQLTGLKGKMAEKENVFKVTKPRDDVKIKVDQWSMPAFMGLTSWAAFTPAADGKVMMMGDTVVFQDEVNPAMSAAFEAGLDVTALHNHFFFDQPKVYFMHIGGVGDESKLAAGVKKVYDKIAEIRSRKSNPDTGFPGSIPASNSISPEPLQKILGMEGESKDGMFKVVAGRPAVMHGVSVGKEMGVNTWAAFAGSDENAVVDGDFVVREDELQAALRTLREGNINIVAIHQHMTHEEPRYIFFHYWGKGNAQDMAKTVRKALDLQTDPVSKQAHGKH